MDVDQGRFTMTDATILPARSLVAEHPDRVSMTRSIFVTHARLHLARVNAVLIQ